MDLEFSIEAFRHLASRIPNPIERRFGIKGKAHAEKDCPCLLSLFTGMDRIYEKTILNILAIHVCNRGAERRRFRPDWPEVWQQGKRPRTEKHCP